ncbi:hypothetical protein ABIC65_001065 [Sphingomonas trueperi]
MTRTLNQIERALVLQSIVTAPSLEIRARRLAAACSYGITEAEVSPL